MIVDRCRRWYNQRFGSWQGRMYCSKLYQPAESFTKRHSWWHQVPLGRIQSASIPFVDLVAQRQFESDDDFLLLRIPGAWFVEHVAQLHCRDDKIELWLSAEPDDFLVDRRSGAALSFNLFLLD